MNDDRRILAELLASETSGTSETSDASDATNVDDAILVDYLSDRLDDDEAERLRARIVNDPALASRVLELEAFVTATPPAETDVTDLETTRAWQDFERRRGNSASLSAQSRGWMAAAAIFFLTTCGLAWWNLMLRGDGLQPVALPRTLTLDADARAAGKPFAMVVGAPLVISVYPANPLPSGCEVYDVEIRDGAGRATSIFGAPPNEFGRLDLLVPDAVPGRHVLTLDACGETTDELVFELLATP
ncbi:MAG: hypothetical protein AAGD38_01845 [Acidobacteriota bacterium]